MDKKGSVLMISLWILAILVVFALGLGQRAIMNLRIAKYQKERLKSSCLAQAGIKRAIAGIGLENSASYEDLAIKEGSQEKFTVSVADEERKININTASKELLAGLLTHRDIQNPDNLANLIRDWIDTDITPSEEEETSVYKNAPLRAPEELLLILEYFYSRDNGPEEARLKAAAAFGKIKDLATLWTGYLNINTISEETLAIFMNSAVPAEKKNLVPGFAAAIINLRQSQPEKVFKQLSDVTLPEAEYADLLNIVTNGGNFGIESNFFRMESRGYIGNVAKNISLVYDKTDDKVVYRREN